MWWIFVSDNSNGLLNLYYSEHLSHGWKSHPQNPLIKINANISRPSGKVFIYENKLYRIAQDAKPVYGESVNAFEITDISTTTYAEKPFLGKPLITKSNKHRSWYAVGMHHLDLHQIGDNWIGIVDGKQW